MRLEVGVPVLLSETEGDSVTELEGVTVLALVPVCEGDEVRLDVPVAVPDKLRDGLAVPD